MLRFLFLSAALSSFAAFSLHADDIGTGPNLLSGDFESGLPDYNPWAGVDGLGDIHVFAGSQYAVDDTGSVRGHPFSPSIAVGDLNGDGLPDLVVGDARGYFWYFPNSGTRTAPAFTHGEIMPLWLGKDWREGDAVPRIQLVDFTGEGKLSIVAGNYFGGLYYFRNAGSKSSPVFKMLSPDRATYQITTRYVDGKDLLWCNYLAPCLYDWGGRGRLDLIMGDGSYSANSIYYFTNMGNNDRPMFNEEHMQKLIPGMGREHLTPAVVDWNNDGKPDIISGERTGVIDLYLNQAATKSDPPVFDKDTPQHVLFGSTEKIGTLTTVCPADMNGDKLFDLSVGSSDGRIMYALNTGSLGQPKFGLPVAYQGKNQYPKIITPRNWQMDRYRTDGVAYELLECTNASVEPDFKPPPDFKGQGALKFSIVKAGNVYFPDTYLSESSQHWIQYKGKVSINAETRYLLSFQARADGDISEISYELNGSQSVPGGGYVSDKWYDGPIIGSGSSSWTRLTQDIRLPNLVKVNPKKVKETGSFTLWIVFKGAGTLYLDDITLKQAE